MANFHITGLPASMMVAGLGLPLLPTDDTYKAIITPTNQRSVVGSILTLDGRASFNPNNLPLTYFWAFKEYPIGSQVEKYLFSSTESDDSIVSFSPDVPGFYTIELVVGDINFLSPFGYAEALISILMVPHNQGLTPDAGFIWNYLGDFWTIYSDKEKFTTIWSSMVQIISNELLTAYQIDYNKSIRDIQDLFQKKWLSYNPKLELEESDIDFILADDQAGVLAATSLLGVATQPTYSNIVTIPKTTGSFTITPYGKTISPGRVLKLNTATYTMLRSTDIGTSSAFFATTTNIKTGATNQPWRFSPTLTSKNLNFESQGIAPGDILEVQINKVGTNLFGVIEVQVVSIDKNKLGFVFNTNEIVNGTPASGISDENLLFLADSLKIKGLSKAINGSLVYTDEALSIKNTIETLQFKRTYYETSLIFDSPINLGVCAITVKPIAIIRNKRIPVDTRVVSVPMLQEYIKQPELVRLGSTINKAVNGKLYTLNEEPSILFENVDYILDDEKSIDVLCDFTKASDIVVIPVGDLIERDIQENDTLLIEVGLNQNFYTIKKVLDNERLQVTPIPIFSEKQRIGKILRRVSGKFIRFVNNLFTTKNPAPEKLWGEVTYIDNSDSIENNFGTLVDLTKERKDKQGIKAPYKATIAGLMYAYSRGPNINNLKLGAQILLGLPFAYHRGVIIEINPEYRLNPNDLSPSYGRILIEGRDKKNRTTGITDVYIYPRGKQIKILGKWEDQDPDFSGLGINPLTGRTFLEGDLVERFTVLSKGVEISDYLSDPNWFRDVIIPADQANNIRKYHTAYLRANIDLYGTADFDFVGSFVRKTKPHYVDLKAIALKSFADDVIVTDDLFFKPIYTFYEAIGLSLPNGVKFDGYYITPEYMTYDGVMYTRYLYGSDLTTQQGSNSVTSQSGGFVTARTEESHDSPYVRSGDLLVITSDLNVGKYKIASVTNDTTALVINTGVFKTLAAQDFTVYRPIKNPIYSGTITITQNVPTCTFGSGILSSGAAVGDTIVMNMNGVPSRQYTVSEILSNGAGALFPAPIEASGTFSCLIIRQGLLLKHMIAADEVEEPFFVTTTMANNWISIVTLDPAQSGFVKTGDTVYVPGHPPYTILDYDETVSEAFVIPQAIQNDALFSKIWRTYLPSKYMSVDVVDRLIEDPLELELKDKLGLAGQTAGSGIVLLLAGAASPVILGVKPGDLIRFITGANSTVNIGYGPGCYPIAETPPAGNSVILTRPLGATVNTSEYSYIKKLR